MSNPLLSIPEQIGTLPEGAVSYRLIPTGDGAVFPAQDKPGLPLKPRFLSPRGLKDGEYYVEFYGEDGEAIPETPGNPVVVTVCRRPAALAPAPAPTPASASAPAPVPQSAEVAEYLRDPEGYEKKVMVRQRGHIRDQVLDTYDANKSMLDKYRDQLETLGASTMKSQQAALDHVLKAMEKVQAWQQKQDEQHIANLAMSTAVAEKYLAKIGEKKDGEAKDRPAADYTQLGVAALGTLEAIAVSLASGGKKNKKKKKDKDAKAEPEKRDAKPGALKGDAKPEAQNGDAKLENKEEKQIELSPEDRARQAIKLLLAYANPANLDNLLSDPEQQKEFADGITRINSQFEKRSQTKVQGDDK